MDVSGARGDGAFGEDGAGSDAARAAERKDTAEVRATKARPPTTTPTPTEMITLLVVVPTSSAGLLDRRPSCK
ncbi:hypothetical protein [Polyangium jinanense]|uniref:hypothetical protein n=1 Tax=Polyangium jinanense TaxID=2829994 RepID=UPI00234236EE|nr:hypothetical protein [Polyangium jinanense]